MDYSSYSNYSTGYTTVTTSTTTIDPAAFVGMILIWLVFGLAFYIVFAIFLSKIFKKLGTTPTWAAWVPVFNQWKFNEAGGQQGWWIFVPIANVIFQVIAAYNIGLKFGKSGSWVALYLFLYPIWVILLGVNSAQPVESPQQMSVLNNYPQQPVAPAQSQQQPQPFATAQQQPTVNAQPQQPQPAMPVQPQQPVEAPQPPQQPTDQPPQV